MTGSNDDATGSFFPFYSELNSGRGGQTQVHNIQAQRYQGAYHEMAHRFAADPCITSNDDGRSGFFSLIQLPYAAAKFTMSTGVKFSPGFPPIVPLIPEMLFINATINRVLEMQK